MIFLDKGPNAFVGLPAGRYRLVVGGASDVTGTSTPAEVSPGGKAQSELRLAKRPVLEVTGLLVSPGANFAGQDVQLHFQTDEFRVLYNFSLGPGSVGAFAIETDDLPPEGASVEILIPALGLGATLRVRPDALNLGAILLEKR